MTMWVFGYGSLLWNPGFPVARREVAVLHGYARSFCMTSIHHRGTEDHPGLVLALDAVEGAHCKGIALSVEAGHEEQTLAELRERELISSAYLERDLEVELAGGSMVTAVTYVIDPHHVQYCGGLSLEEQAQMIAHAVGGRGPNTEYLYNTAEHLAEIGLHDSDLDWLAGRVREITA
ncbi:gamma-glutamylcyclotransferase [Leisingera caerulea]|uniref:glutathione-specific gamma-glutamylcyclotransferase n=1 Tax=Leisingera caerulea TaxID=506591 RepID=A0ABY5WZF6_LEICA|nr:gamma-glutamylcyclotransferase [Leisingera caerulea]UWQ50718.1 gamma-glutamylcyclotransferase [Leisingera caerulea]UWQ59410.1 gamma-glutamylcyclotransferase [Leisingera caerulea]UWQ84442.1 gamma-glutamylcyclotransferase [Leisingera caerulea]